MRTASLLIVSALIGACGTDYEVSEQPLTGVVGGSPWAFAAGDTSAFLSDGDAFFANLYATEFEACGFGQPDGNSLILNIPKEPGEYELSLQRNMTFVVDGPDGPENLIGIKGLLIVDSITATSISGGIYARFNGDNEVDGTFTVSICEE